MRNVRLRPLISRHLHSDRSVQLMRSRKNNLSLNSGLRSTILYSVGMDATESRDTIATQLFSKASSIFSRRLRPFSPACQRRLATPEHVAYLFDVKGEWNNMGTFDKFIQPESKDIAELQCIVRVGVSLRKVLAP